MKQEHHNKSNQTYHKGVDSDTESEFSGANDSGEYRASRNSRSVSITGDIGAQVKINGDELEHDLTNVANGLSSNYQCLNTESINGYKVSCWASPSTSEYSAISIDDKIVCKSVDLPFSVDFPIQSDKNENCLGGEYFITDFNSEPMIFDIQDLLDSLTTNPLKYFSLFSINEYTVNLSSPLDIPVFQELVPLGAGGGLPIGNYSYSIRYVSDDGDRTNFGPNTPTIAVVSELNYESRIYPSSMTTGDVPNINNNTNYGIKLRFRVNNKYNYDFIEIRRYSWNSGTSEFFVPAGVIVAKVQIDDAEVSIKTFIDPEMSNANEVISDEEETVQLEFISKAKGIRYYDKRLVLMNIETGTRDYTPSFKQDVNNRYMFPCMQKLYKAGHNDPFARTYYKNYMGGESFSFSISGYDGVGGKGFSVPIPNDNGEFNYIVPNRRTEIANGSPEDIYSYEGMSVARGVNGNISKTLEVFDHDDATTKTDDCSIVGIGAPKNNTTMQRAGSGLKTYCDEDPAIEGAKKSDPTQYQSNYQPFRPTGANDDDSARHNVKINTKACLKLVLDEDDPNQYADYNPQAFGLDYYSRGMVVQGVDDLPSWMKSFTISRTRRADRVICQGLGVYNLLQAGLETFDDDLDNKMSKKLKNKMWFYSPDIESGVVSQEIITGIQNGDYEVQFVSPLGFFTEMYNFHKDVDTIYGNPKDRIIDMLSYARILHDEGQINPTDNPGYVGYNRWRNDADGYNQGFFSGGNGDNIMNVVSIDAKQDGRTTFYELLFEDNIYNTDGQPNVTFGNERNFHEQKIKDWHEPVYVINIIQSGKVQRDQDIDSYLDTGTYIKRESLIGNTSTSGNFFELVDERWEDCIPALTSTHVNSTKERFTYVRDVLGQEEAWLNVDFRTPADISSIINDISANGFHVTPQRGINVFGVYTSNIVNATLLAQGSGSVRKLVTLNFNVVGSEVTVDKKIYVKYDSDAPIRVFGGDSTVSESMFSVIDREADGGGGLGGEKKKQFRLGAPFPFLGYEINPRIFQMTKGANVSPVVQNWGTPGRFKRGYLGYIRQMCYNFTCEQRSSEEYSYSTDSPLQSFPRVHYIMRPHEFKDNEFPSGDLNAIYSDNSVDIQYGIDYGDEYLRWKFGGLRVQGQFNKDYSSKPPIEFFSKKEFGFEEKNEFCTRILWSRPRAINQQDSPGLKTFLSTSVFDISDDNGEIKKAYDENTMKGNNLYAFTESGTCLLLTKKSILSDLNSGELAYMAGDRFISKQYWIDNKIGMTDEFWRSAAEGSIAIKGDLGIDRREGIFWANRGSVFMMANNNIKDIGRHKYYATIKPFLDKIGPGYESVLHGYYDPKYDEYGIASQNSFGGELDIPLIINEHHVYSQRNNLWIGERDYFFDRYLSSDGELYGHINGQTYIMDRGLLINGGTIQWNILQACSPEPLYEKEYIRIQINSTTKPTRIIFYDRSEVKLGQIDETNNGVYYLKKYDGWEAFIPRRALYSDVDRKRMQDRVILFRIFHTEQEDFKLISTSIQYKVLK